MTISINSDYLSIVLVKIWSQISIKFWLFRFQLKEKRDYKIFVDVDNRCFVDGKLFFPLGMYSVQLNATQYEDFIDSPFNVVMSSVTYNKQQLDTFFEKTNRQVRIINIFLTSC